MTQLRQRMIEDMQLRGYSARTQEAYARAVRQLAEFFHRSPDQLTEEELRRYVTYIEPVVTSLPAIARIRHSGRCRAFVILDALVYIL